MAEQKAGLLHIRCWDVGRGTAVAIQGPAGGWLLFDLGQKALGKGKVFSPVRHLYREYGVREVEHIILSHPHQDHIADLPAALDLLKAKHWACPQHLLRREVMKGVGQRHRALFQQYWNVQKEAALWDGWRQWQGMELALFSPQPKGRGGQNHQNPNNHSLVLLLRWQGFQMVLCGDNEAASWRWLMAQPAFAEALPATTVLLAPHHGRRSSFYAAAVKAMSPQVTIIQDGARQKTSVTHAYTRKSSGRHLLAASHIQHRKVLSSRRDGRIYLQAGTDPLTGDFYWRVEGNI